MLAFDWAMSMKPFTPKDVEIDGNGVDEDPNTEVPFDLVDLLVQGDLHAELVENHVIRRRVEREC